MNPVFRLKENVNSLLETVQTPRKCKSTITEVANDCFVEF